MGGTRERFAGMLLVAALVTALSGCGAAQTWTDDEKDAADRVGGVAATGVGQATITTVDESTGDEVRAPSGTVRVVVPEYVDFEEAFSVFTSNLATIGYSLALSDCVDSGDMVVTCSGRYGEVSVLETPRVIVWTADKSVFVVPQLQA